MSTFVLCDYIDGGRSHGGEPTNPPTHMHLRRWNTSSLANRTLTLTSGTSVQGFRPGTFRGNSFARGGGGHITTAATLEVTRAGYFGQRPGTPSQLSPHRSYITSVTILANNAARTKRFITGEPHGIQTRSYTQKLTMTNIPTATGANPKEHQININITETERSLFDLLERTTKYIEETHGTKVVLRVAGGWVRDKILALESDDIDIAIDCMTGEQFAGHLKEYCESIGEQSMLRTIATVKVNPEKSKHLATATTIINGLSIDLVNLRSEEYASDSRTPTTTFGTPEEDSLRRDITINALFYNINTGLIEDFTGKGIQDLKDGVVRTPLDSLITFTDDPLRIMRVIRFATRFKYSIDSEIEKAFVHPQLKSALEIKVSRERIGTELFKTLHNGQEPQRALDILYRYEFLGPIFTSDRVPALLEPIKDFKYSKSSFDIIHDLVELVKDDKRVKEMDPDCLTVLKSILGDKERLTYLYLATLVIPWANPVMMTKNNYDHIKLGEYIRSLIWDCIKLNNSQANYIEALYANYPLIKEAAEEHDTTGRMTNDDERNGLNRGQLGDLVVAVGKKTLQQDWSLSIFMSALIDTIFSNDTQQHPAQDLYKTFLTVFHTHYSSLIIDVHKMNLDTAYKTRPVLNGGEVAKALGVRPGPTIGTVLAKLLHRQFQVGEGFSKTDAISWIEANKNELLP